MDDTKEKIIPVPPTSSPVISSELLAALTSLLAANSAQTPPTGPAVDQATAKGTAGGGNPATVAGEADATMAAIQAGATLGNALVSSPLVRRSAHRLASRKFWVVVVTLAGLLSQNVTGLTLKPLDTLVIAGLAAVWTIVQGMIDAKEGGNG